MTTLPITDWLAVGQPKNVWFTIARNETLAKANSNTPKMLAELIKVGLERFGNYETRRTDLAFLEAYAPFEGEDFLIYHGLDAVNGKVTPIVIMCVDVRII